MSRTGRTWFQIFSRAERSASGRVFSDPPVDLTSRRLCYRPERRRSYSFEYLGRTAQIRVGIVVSRRATQCIGPPWPRLFREWGFAIDGELDKTLRGDGGGPMKTAPPFLGRALPVVSTTAGDWSTGFIGGALAARVRIRGRRWP